MSTGLKVHDMIICINGKGIGSMTLPEFQIELDVCGSEMLLVVSRFDIQETDSLRELTTLEDLAMDWSDIGAGATIKTNRVSFEDDRSSGDICEQKIQMNEGGVELAKHVGSICESAGTGRHPSLGSYEEADIFKCLPVTAHQTVNTCVDKTSHPPLKKKSNKYLTKQDIMKGAASGCNKCKQELEAGVKKRERHCLSCPNAGGKKEVENSSQNKIMGQLMTVSNPIANHQFIDNFDLLDFSSTELASNYRIVADNFDSSLLVQGQLVAFCATRDKTATRRWVVGKISALNVDKFHWARVKEYSNREYVFATNVMARLNYGKEWHFVAGYGEEGGLVPPPRLHSSSLVDDTSWLCHNRNCGRSNHASKKRCSDCYSWKGDSATARTTKKKPVSRYQKQLEELSNDGSDISSGDDCDAFDDDENPWLGCVCGNSHPKPIQVFWIQCESCDAWYNVAEECVGFNEEAAGTIDKWSCPACSVLIPPN